MSKLLTPQQVFNRVVAHARTQGRAAMEQMPWSVSAKDQDVMDAYATLRTPLLNTLRHVRDLSAQWYHVLNHIPMTPVVVGPNKPPQFSHRG